MALAVILVSLLFAVLSWFIVEKRFLDRFKENKTIQIPAV